MPKENKTSAPSRIALEVEHEFRASHSLAGFETPHFHLWKIGVQFEAALPLATDRLIDLVFLQTTLEQILQPLSGAYLNDALSYSPTSENLALWIWEKIAAALPDAPLQHVKISICDLEGRSTGAAKVSR